MAHPSWTNDVPVDARAVLAVFEEGVILRMIEVRFKFHSRV